MINFDKTELIDKINSISKICYKPNFLFGNGNASINIVNILKKINYKNTEKVISYYK